MVKTVLVVDDSRTELEHITSVVESNGYNVIRAMDGNEAVKQAISQHPNLIF